MLTIVYRVTIVNKPLDNLNSDENTNNINTRLVMNKIWNEFELGALKLKHRLALAPMTRLRALQDGTPSDLAVKYYQQRASLGLLISEGTQPSKVGQGYVGSPGIYTAEHIDGWRKVTDAVHSQHAHIFIQLMHAGRVSHSSILNGEIPVAPSAIATPQEIFTAEGPQNAPVPRALETAEIDLVQNEFVQAAQNAIAAGADGVEIHGANGYLLWQFLNTNSNQRKDVYGGSIENRARMMIEVVQKVAATIGADKTGIRLSPNMNFLGMHEDEDWKDIYRYLVTELEKLSLAYVHLFYFGDDEFLAELRGILKNTPLLLVKAGREIKSIEQDLENNIADIFPIATMAIANPDIVERLKQGNVLAKPDPDTFYAGGAHGYTDYPFSNSFI